VFFESEKGFPTYKKFSGRRYEFERASRKKIELEKRGRQLKRWGWIDSYRVIKRNGLYGLYSR